MTTKKKKERQFYVTCKGMSYYVTPDTMKEIARVTPLMARFEREPDNQFDENAIKVILSEKPYRDFHVGHVARGTAKELAPRMDSGDFKPGEVWVTTVDYERGEAEVLVMVKSSQAKI